MNRWLIYIVLAFYLQASYSTASEKTGCKNWFALLSGKVISTSQELFQKIYPKGMPLEEYLALKGKNVADYFPADIPRSNSADPLVQEQIPKEYRDPFFTDFDKVMKNHSRFTGNLYRQKEFAKWWEGIREQVLSRSLIEALKKNNTSMGGFVASMHDQFMRTQTPPTLLERTKNIVTNPVVLTGAVVGVGSVLGKFLVNLLVMGPGVQIVNSYTNPVVVPIAQTAQQRGSQDLDWLANWVQGALSDADKSKKMKDELQTVNLKLEGLSDEEAAARWGEFEKEFFDIFMRYNKNLPAHLRDGRGQQKDTVMLTPMYLAQAMATFDTQYWTHRRELKVLEDRLKAGQKLDAEDERLVKYHRDQMNGAESRIAGTLVNWKMFEYMYPDLAQLPQNKASNKSLANSYQVFRDSMRFDIYVHEFRGQTNQFLKELGGPEIREPKK